jgi:hypothetical protein
VRNPRSVSETAKIQNIKPETTQHFSKNVFIGNKIVERGAFLD